MNVQITDQDFLAMGAAALRKAALNHEAKAYVMAHPPLFSLLKRAADRYIGGETMEETIVKVKSHEQQGFQCSVEFMGENTNTELEANAARDEFIRLARELHALGSKATISLDLSHIGLAISKELAIENLDRICAETPNEVMISAEGAERTGDVLETYLNVAARNAQLGITLQAYLHRTKDDFEELLKLPGRIRIVKGAFETPAGASLPRGKVLNEIYLTYVDRLLSAHHLCSIATHDSVIQSEALKLLNSHQPKKEQYEFESLFGICNDQLAQLRDAGHPARVYFVYGTEWYLYVCNRLAEYPMNLFRAIHDVVSEGSDKP